MPSAFRTIRTGVAQPVTAAEPSQVLLVGQASINYVTRVKDGPLALERSYRVENRSDGKPANEYQVGGQALVPALLLDRWACRSALFTTIGYDDDGAAVRRALMSTGNVALEGLVQHKDVLTDRSYVITYGDVRILIDSGTSNSEAVDANQVKTEILPAIVHSLDEAPGDRRLLYLTKWFLHPIVAEVPARHARLSHGGRIRGLPAQARSSNRHPLVELAVRPAPPATADEPGFRLSSERDGSRSDRARRLGPQL
jgi:hypothetical protein